MDGSETELLYYRDLLQTIFDTSLYQMSILQAVRDKEGQLLDFRIMVANRELEKVTGRRDLVGKLYGDEYPGIKTSGLYEVMARVLDTGKPEQLEHFYPFDGFHKWSSSMFVKLDDSLIATYQDITDRKKEELANLEYSHFIEKLTIASPDNVFVMNIHTKEIVYTNRSPAQALGYSLEERAKLNNEYIDIVHPEDLPYFLQHIENMRTALDGEVRIAEYHVIDAKGRIRWMHDRNAVFRRDESGEVIEKIGVSHEVTEQKKAQEEVVRLNLLQQKAVLDAVLNEQEKERERIGEALHNGIGQLLYAAQIKCDLLKEEEVADRKTIKELSEILVEAIRETRNISFELIPTIIKDFGLVEAIKALLRRWEHSDLHIVFSTSGLDKRLPEHLEISIYRMAQELLGNILKHAKATKATISIEQSASSLQLKVIDNGLGFDESQVWKESKGLGLLGIKNRAKLLNADLNILTAAGQGTRIEIDIPLEHT